MVISEIENASLESIYWWNRCESYYHKYFSQLQNIYKNKPLLDFFREKIFQVFLREYSVRRNLKTGLASVEKFIDELFKFGFVDSVQTGRIEIIDEVCMKLKKEDNSTNRNTVSLLSKVAFLINPNDFFLYDTLAKNSIWNLKKSKKEFKYKDLQQYSKFYYQVDLIRKEIKSEGLFKISLETLSKFKNTSAHDFFGNNYDAFERRISDKYLWILNQQSLGREINNNPYITLIKEY